MIRPLFYVLMAMLSVQLGASFAKGLFSTFGPELVTVLRVSLAAVILLIFFRPRKWSDVWKQRRWLLPYGISLGLMNFAFYQALEKIPLGIAVAIEFTGPLLLSVLFSRRALDFIWVFMAGAGLFILSPFYQMDPSQQNFHHLNMVGIIWALIAGFFWAFYIFWGGKVSQVLDAKYASSFGMAIAAIVSLPGLLLSQNLNTLQGGVFLKQIPIGVLVALLSSAIPYSLEMIALKKIPPKNFGILMSLEPVIAALTGLWMLGEVLNPSQILSILLIICASLGSLLGFRKAPIQMDI